MWGNKKKMVSAERYYNKIAAEYDDKLSIEKDTIIRNEIREYLTGNLSSGTVLDFGGGTGLDLKWLVDSEYDVVFCEPAEMMRAKALALTENWPAANKPKFVDLADSNFANWTAENNPFDAKINAVLANFGVINYIEDLEHFFSIFEAITEKDAQLFINLLSIPPKIKYSKLWKNVLKAIVKRRTIRAGSSFEDITHETILYSISDIEKAAKTKFKLTNTKILGGNTDFTLLHFTKI